MTRRTKTYIAADWTGDKNAVDKLYEWKEGKKWSLDFSNAHDLTQARDGSLNCSIKRSLATRLDASKTFVLIVGANTKTVRSGGCQYCDSYNSYTKACAKGNSVDLKSYIEYECGKAVRDRLSIVILYNAATVDKNKCPDEIKTYGTDAAMQKMENGKHVWDYKSVKTAMGQ
jgi:hypothetical protein